MIMSCAIVRLTNSGFSSASRSLVRATRSGSGCDIEDVPRSGLRASVINLLGNDLGNGLEPYRTAFYLSLFERCPGQGPGHDEVNLAQAPRTRISETSSRRRHMRQDPAQLALGWVNEAE